MRSSRNAAIVFAGIFLFSGCADSAAPSMDENQAAFDFMNGPATPGQSGIERLEYAVNLRTTTDPDEGLVARHFQADDWDGCGGNQPFPEWSTQIKTVGNVEHLLARLDGAPVLIYPFFDRSKPRCDFYREDWLYRGTHDIQVHDNNYTGDASRNIDTWGWRASGIVYDSDGNAFRYQENQTWYYNPAGGDYAPRQRSIRIRRMR